MDFDDEELQARVGEELAKDLTLEQLKEFEALMDADQNVIKKMVAGLTSDFRTDPLYLKLLENHGVEAGNWDILAEYLSIRWIKQNCPNYQEVVDRVTRELGKKAS